MMSVSQLVSQPAVSEYAPEVCGSAGAGVHPYYFSIQPCQSAAMLTNESGFSLQMKWAV